MANRPIKHGSDSDYLSSQRILNLPEPLNSTEPVRKIDLDTAIQNLAATATGRVVLIDIDCSNNPNYPATELGDAYFVQEGGRIGGVDGKVVDVGDEIRCLGKEVNGEQVGSDGGTEAEVGEEFYIIQGNREQATTNSFGLVKLATQQEVNDGSSGDKVVTPATLNQKLISLINSQLEYTANVGNGTLDTFNISHPLGTNNVNVTLIENASGENWHVAWDAPSGSTVNLYFSTPPNINQFKVIIKR